MSYNDGSCQKQACVIVIQKSNIQRHTLSLILIRKNNYHFPHVPQ